MCTSPGLLPDGTQIACRQCWQCRQTRIDDYVGRCIAEIKTCKRAFRVTLTYGRDETGRVDHLHSTVLTYSDVQKYIKRLRFDGYRFKFFAVGETGSEKERAHWHLLLMFADDNVPEHKLETEKYMQPHWCHGFSYWEKPERDAVSYMCKYILKDVEATDGKQSYCSYSKTPPLGRKFFRQLAYRYVMAGLAPQDFFYSWPDVTRGDLGKPIRFCMQGKTRSDFLRAYLTYWKRRNGRRKWPPSSEIIEVELDRLARLADGREPGIEPYRGAVPIPRKWCLMHGATEPRVNEVMNAYECFLDGKRYLWCYNSEGDLEWQEKPGSDPAKAALSKAQEESRLRSNSYRHSKGE